MWKINLFVLAINVSTFAAFTAPTWNYFNPPAGPLQTIRTQARGIYSQLDTFNTQVNNQVSRVTGRY
jgi:hypothetical protein